MRRFRLAALAAAVALIAAALAGCGGGSSSSGNGDDTLVVMATTTSSYQRNFNPFSTSVNMGTRGLLYEPLIIFTAMKPDQPTPWLATDQKWNDTGTQLTLTIREGVTWSDGKPFSSKDVAFTFQMLHDNPALNTSSITFDKVEAPDDTTVVLTFPSVAFSQLTRIGSVTPVPEHVFGGQDAMTFTNPDPVVTGPYTLKSFSAQVYLMTANDKYWQADKIKVKNVQFPAVSTNSFDTLLGQGKLDWSGGFVANVDKTFIEKDPEHNKTWFPSDGLVNLVLNLTKAPFDDPVVRRAISTAIDRPELSETAVYGYAQPASPTGLVLPAFGDYLDPQYDGAEFTQDADEANKLLDDAGYEKGTDGIRVGKNGERLSFSIVVPSGFTDWVTMTKLLQDQFKTIGIELSPEGKATQAWSADIKTGNFDMTIAGAPGGASPYFLYRGFLSSALTAPVGERAVTNYSRWSDPATDQLLTDFENTSDPEEQKDAIYGLQKIMMEQLPVIPLVGSTSWCEYRTDKFVGWPTEDDPYALPAPYQFPDNLLIVTNLEPAK